MPKMDRYVPSLQNFVPGLWSLFHSSPSSHILSLGLLTFFHLGCVSTSKRPLHDKGSGAVHRDAILLLEYLVSASKCHARGAGQSSW